MLCTAEDEEVEALREVTALVGAADASALATDSGGGGDSGSVEALLRQLRAEPADAAECAAKFGLYEDYAVQVERIRGSLISFAAESVPSMPPAVASGVRRQLEAVDSHEAMSVPDDDQTWFVFHMMRQAERNNRTMAETLRSFERKLELLSKGDQAECPVCLEGFAEEGGARAATTLACCHKVCQECWSYWTAVTTGRPFCPLCRHGEFQEVVAMRARALEL